MKPCKVYKDGECIEHYRERRTKPRRTYPYYLALIIFAVVLAVVVNQITL